MITTVNIYDVKSATIERSPVNTRWVQIRIVGEDGEEQSIILYGYDVQIIVGPDLTLEKLVHAAMVEGAP